MATVRRSPTDITKRASPTRHPRPSYDEFAVDCAASWVPHLVAGHTHSPSASQRAQWADFYRAVHESPTPKTYRELFTSDVDLSDPAGRWRGIEEWSAEEREAISMGVLAKVVALLASRGLTVLEIDFDNPAGWPDTAHHTRRSCTDSTTGGRNGCEFTIQQDRHHADRQALAAGSQNGVPRTPRPDAKHP